MERLPRRESTPSDEHLHLAFYKTQWFGSRSGLGLFPVPNTGLREEKPAALQVAVLWGLHERRLRGHGFKSIESLYLPVSNCTGC